MEWYVYRYDFNKREIVPFDVFRRADFKEDVEEIDIKNISYKDFKNRLDRLTLYYFWSKCEWEIIICPWVGKADDIKIDVYDQLMLNWDKFVDDVWSEVHK